MRPPAILQFASQLCQCDAVGNEVFALESLLRRQGINSQICCDRADGSSAKRVRSWRSAAHLKWDALLIHYSHGFASSRGVFSAPAEQRILVYHSVTPPEYLHGTSAALEQASRRGHAELSEYADQVQLAIAHSSFSARELEAAGFRKILVLPYVLWESLYTIKADRSFLDRYRRDGWVNLLTVGRVAPNKCLEDCILTFDYFKRAVKKQSRLFIVGHWEGTEAYLARLQRLVAKLGVQDVFFTGLVPQETLIGFFELADAFLCMSDHEGFGVPLVEAMRYGVPIFAHASTAIPETLRGTGVLFPEKCWPVVAEAVGLLLADPDLRERVISEQRRQAAFYSSEAAWERLRRCLESCNLVGGAREGDPRPAPMPEVT